MSEDPCKHRTCRPAGGRILRGVLHGRDERTSVPGSGVKNAEWPKLGPPSPERKVLRDRHSTIRQSRFMRPELAISEAGSGKRIGVPVADAFLQGTVHEAREDLQAAVQSDHSVLALWKSLTPLGRNEFICWVDDAKQVATRQRRIARTLEQLLEGKRRPCCWAGCIHRTDKPPSRWQQAVLIGGKKTSPTD